MTVAAPTPALATSFIASAPRTAPEWQRDRLAEAAHLGPSTGYVLAVVLSRTNWRTGRAWGLSEAQWCAEAGGMPSRTWRYHLARLRGAGVLWTTRRGRGRGRGRGVAEYAVTSGNPLPVVVTRENDPPAPPPASDNGSAYNRQPIAALSASTDIPIGSVSSPRVRDRGETPAPRPPDLSDPLKSAAYRKAREDYNRLRARRGLPVLPRKSPRAPRVPDGAPEGLERPTAAPSQVDTD